jgi:hypothetical protein
MKFRDYILNEDKLKTDDMKNLRKFINKPKKTTFILKSFRKYYEKDEREVGVLKKGDTVVFEYNKDFYELTVFLTDLCDENDYTFKTYDEREINTTVFEVHKK